MTDGKMWSVPSGLRPCLEISASNSVLITWLGPKSAADPFIRQIVGGGQIIVEDGKPVELTNQFAIVRNPRTAVGVDRSGKLLTLLVVDGRQPELSAGMTLPELAIEMIRLGCFSAINLDGGGSSTLVYRDPKNQKPGVINSPSDKKERSVADVLGVRVNQPFLPEVDHFE
jgi:exopolysaccharide biosynthesis protein